MELNEDYENIDSFDPKTTSEGKRNPEERKPDYGDQATKSARVRRPLRIIYAVLSLSTLLSLLTLVTAIILIRQISSEFEKSETVLRMDFIQWKNNVTGKYEVMSGALIGLQAEISRLRQFTGSVSSSLAELQAEISQLKDLHSCPSAWAFFKQSCYLFSSKSKLKTWEEAKDSCMSAQAHLVVVNDAEEQDFLRKENQVPRWIGLSDKASKDDWRWVDGTDYKSSVKFWRKGEPNNVNDENCVELPSDGNWNDLSCSKTLGWICEKLPQ